MSVIQSLRTHRKMLVAVVLGIVSMYALVTWSVSQKLAALDSTLERQILDQENTLVALSVVTARNGADATIESVIKDCQSTDRTKFDTLLGSLNRNLPRADLQELDRLFGRCANFFAARKGLMVGRLERELLVYESLLEQRQQYTSVTTDSLETLKQWKELVAAEKKLSEGFATLVTLQDRIIQSLLAGETATSPAITELLTSVGQVQDTLSVTNTQVRALRGQLVPAEA